MSTRAKRQKRYGNDRAIWPPETMVAIEAEQNRAFVDIMADLVTEHGVRRACEQLAGTTTLPNPRYPVQPETIREWWRIACDRDPQMASQVKTARIARKAEKRAQVEAERKEAKRQSDEETQMLNGMAGKTCCVCGAPLPARRGTTCERRCAELWQQSRYNINEEENEKHRVIVALRVIERSDDPAFLNYARKIIRDEPIQDRGRWLNSKEQLARLEEVMERRAAAKAKWGDMAADLPPIRALERGIARKDVA